MTKSDIDRLRELLSKATPGPWEGVPAADDVKGDDIDIKCDGAIIGIIWGFDNYPCADDEDFEPFTIRQIADADLIADLRNFADELLAAAEENVKLRRALERILAAAPETSGYDEIDGVYECCHCYASARSIARVIHDDTCYEAALKAARAALEGK